MKAYAENAKRTEPLAKCGNRTLHRMAEGYAWLDETGRVVSPIMADALQVFSLAYPVDMRLTGRKAVAAVTFRQNKGGARLPSTARPHGNKSGAERHLADMSGMAALARQTWQGKRIQRYMNRLSNGQTLA